MIGTYKEKAMKKFDIRFKLDKPFTITIDANDDTEALSRFFKIYPEAIALGISEVIVVDTPPKGTHDYV